MSGSSQQAGRISHLSDEIILQVLESPPDLPTLFEIANNVSPVTLKYPPWSLHSQFVDRYPLQLQKPIKFDICVLYRKTSHEQKLKKHLVSNLENLRPIPPSTASNLQDFLPPENPDEKLPDLLLQHPPTAELPPFLIPDSIYDPATIMQDMGVVSSDMALLVSSVVNTRLYRTHAKMRRVTTEEYQARSRHCHVGGRSRARHEEHYRPVYCLKADYSSHESSTRSANPRYRRHRTGISITHRASPHTASEPSGGSCSTVMFSMNRNHSTLLSTKRSNSDAPMAVFGDTKRSGI